jgi:molybdenum cofactor guanylyltransferase
MEGMREPIAGVLLAGGRSSRVGGGDKCLLTLQGKPLLAYAIEQLTPQVDAMVLNANGDPKRFASFGLPVIADESEDYAGPLAGILAGMEWANDEAPNLRCIVTVPTDTPFYPADLVVRLLQAQGGQNKPVIAASESGEHPVFGLWPVTLAPALRADLAAGMRKTLDWAHAQGAISVSFEPTQMAGRSVDPFFNINEMTDLATAEALLEGR